jgi:hypothetical protein
MEFKLIGFFKHCFDDIFECPFKPQLGQILILSLPLLESNNNLLFAGKAPLTFFLLVGVLGLNFKSLIRLLIEKVGEYLF